MKRKELLVFVDGEELCEECSPSEYWTPEAIDRWRDDLNGPEGLDDEQIDEMLDGMTGWKTGSSFGDNLGRLASRLFLGPYLEAQHIGMIRGLQFRVSELEQEDKKNEVLIHLLTAALVRVIPHLKKNTVLYSNVKATIEASKEEIGE